MKREITDLIQRYFELGLITTSLIPMKGPGQSGDHGSSLIYKEVRMRTSKAWEIKDPTTQDYSDDLAIALIEKEKTIIANELFEMTKAIIYAEGVQEDIVYGTVKYLTIDDEVKFSRDTGDPSHLDKMMWSMIRLRKLKIISPFIRQYLQPVMDIDGVLLGNKVVPEEHLDKLEDPTDEYPNENGG